MENNFNLQKFLVENKLTSNNKFLNESPADSSNSSLKGSIQEMGMSKNDRIKLLQDAKQQLREVISNIGLALKDTNFQDYAEAHIVSHLTYWADDGGYDMGVQQYIEEFEEGGIYVA